MSEQEFELYLKLLSRCLGLTPGQREQIADELRDHLEQRLAELEQAGVARDKAVVQALDEFGDAAALAANFAAIARLKRRRFLMRLSLGSVGALTAALLIAFAFWPDNRAVRGPERVAAQEKPGKAAAAPIAEPVAGTATKPANGGLAVAATGPPPVVEVCRPVKKEVTDFQTFAGNVQPSQFVRLRTRATGYLRKVCFRPGQVVKPGDLLFEIDPATYQVDLDRAKAEVDRAEAKVKLALAKAAEVKQLNQLGQGMRGNTQVESEQECQIARADLQMARANQEAAQLRLGWTRITAPLGGYISRSAFDVGSLVKAEESTLAMISCLDPVYVSITMDQQTWFALRKEIHSGEFKSSEVPVEVSVPLARSRPGFLEFSDDADFNNGSGGTAMRARVPNQDATFVTGVLVRVAYAVGKPHAVFLIPIGACNTAMWADGGRNPVWVVGDDNTARRRWVRVSPSTHSNQLEVRDGLKPDEWIVCHADGQLVDGKRIEPKRLP
jgi:RND family efflux transporter MFP subunit